jgi:Tol biopolymer transport system component
VDPLGKTLAFANVRQGNADIFMLPLEGDRKPKPFVEVRGSLQTEAVFSPDGRWVAYMSNELQSLGQIFVQPYPGGAKYQITTEGGYAPVWSPDGKQLFYYSEDNKLLAVEIQTQPAFSYGKPSPLPIVGMLKEGPSAARNYDITPDGKRFLVILQASQSDVNVRPSAQINVVLNWFRELQERVP